MVYRNNKYMNNLFLIHFCQRAIVLFALTFFLSLSGNAQSGCTDPQANNYDPQATENDGSCLYSDTNYDPICLATLGDEIKECSGLQYFDGQVWALNDGGDGPQIYQLDTIDGSVIRSVWIEDQTHVDWEDLAQDSLHLYIGDFGNNLGTRKDFKIIKIKKSDLTEDSVQSETIYFDFADQTNFTSRNRAHNYDCEAFFFHESNLYLFSKNWLNNQTRLYQLSAEPGTYSISPIDSFNVNGLITAADISPKGDYIMLLGYRSNTNTFMYLLFDYQPFRPFSGNKRRIKTGTFLTSGQVEGICFQGNDEGFIGSEEITIIDPKLKHFKIGQWVENPMTYAAGTPKKPPLHIYPNPFREELLIDAKVDGYKIKKAELWSSSGQLVKRKRKGLKRKIRFDGSKVASGAYVLRIFLKKGGVVSKQVVKF